MEKKINKVLLLGIIFVAMNLRSPITAVGPLIGIISDDLILSGGQAGLITTIPLMSFAIISPIAPKLANKWTIEKTIFGALIVLVLGMFLRAIPQLTFLFLGTTLLGAAIAICNVLIPGLVKKEFPHQSGLVTGIYSVSMNLTGAIASGISIPLVRKIGLDWNVALGLWSILALTAFVCWLPQLKRQDKEVQEMTPQENSSIWTSTLAWSVTLFMGIQSFIFYVLVAWLPEMLVDKGLSTIQAGGMLSLLQMTLLPITFIVPIIAEKRPNQKSFVWVSFLLFAFGILGLMGNNMKIVSLSIMGIGIAGGIAFSLSMMFFNLRTTSAKQAAELSGMAQSIGYLLAATGPFLFGFLHDVTKTWQSSLIILLMMTSILLIVGLNSAKKRVI
ncbi:CynX/NimT family MFS transporter [Vagococcus luciliae]|uniref:Transporter YycB n=1 Tax=Vagococcus luciliae TaxID=2920380 RepID=A0ABY5NWT3_9ENTE|nr:MFS transporter [Vagococcus luciliae]UUV98058.1 putative transporter YycB [Vagococcus luciliae]